ncbi:MAG TPA: asparagine synthetase B family protein [Gemmatimonadaceae bacterium]|nr:asparagine synthetase B family protein [Gemmatimonadaceae bacterium]
MTAILGVFSSGGDKRTPSETVGRRMLEAMRARGIEVSEIRSFDGAMVAASRHVWECAPDLAGETLILEWDGLVVAADASLYYRADLRSALGRCGVMPQGDDPAHLVAAAYRAWGDDCAERLEGDFAFIVWNRKTGRVCAARDFAGKRTLAYAQLGGTLVIASTVSGVLAHPECPAELNLAAIAATASGMFAAGHETAYTAVQTVPGGWTLVRRAEQRAELFRHWIPPVANDRGRSGPSFVDGALQLRELLERATLERMPAQGRAAVWLSGGWDSSAVFGVAKQVLQERGDKRLVLPVSMSYPAGDPGREDELIQSIADWWDAEVHWVRIGDVPFFERPAHRAARRDEPFAHAFEMWHRALARGTRAVGARVAFDGMGGDQLFQVSEVYFADLLRTGHWIELARDWRARGGGFGVRDAREFVRTVLDPLVSERARRAITVLRRGRRPTGYLERRPPSWIRREFAKEHQLEERERAFAPQRGRVSCAAFETEWYLSHAYFPRVFGAVAGFALEEGVISRSPLYDRRVIEFAATRPRWERATGRETKLLLRRAVRGLVPDGVLAPRAARTGVTSGYFDDSMRKHFPGLSNGLMQDSALRDVGIIDAEEFQRWSDYYVRNGGQQLGVTLLFTLQTELWLRSRVRPIDALVGELDTARETVGRS